MVEIEKIQYSMNPPFAITPVEIPPLQKPKLYETYLQNIKISLERKVAFLERFYCKIIENLLRPFLFFT